jgi:hypothetical protein
MNCNARKAAIRPVYLRSHPIGPEALMEENVEKLVDKQKTR